MTALTGPSRGCMSGSRGGGKGRDCPPRGRGRLRQAGMRREERAPERTLRNGPVRRLPDRKRTVDAPRGCGTRTRRPDPRGLPCRGGLRRGGRRSAFSRRADGSCGPASPPRSRVRSTPVRRGVPPADGAGKPEEDAASGCPRPGNGTASFRSAHGERERAADGSTWCPRSRRDAGTESGPCVRRAGDRLPGTCPEVTPARSRTSRRCASPGRTRPRRDAPSAPDPCACPRSPSRAAAASPRPRRPNPAP